MTSRKTPHAIDVASDLQVLVAREFRQLQRDPKLQNMSIFDLIDHCTDTFESVLSTSDSLARFVQAYLIFNYFINNFIMMHFNGFQDFLESAHHDFVLYLNLYSFFKFESEANETSTLPKNGKVFEYSGSHVHSSKVIDVILAYLQENRLLSFDIALLHNWLDTYIEYYRHNEGGSAGSDSPTKKTNPHATNSKRASQSEQSPRMSHKRKPSKTSPRLPEPTPEMTGSQMQSPVSTFRSPDSKFSARFEDLDFSDDDLFEFNSKFPDLAPDKSPSRSAPYPVEIPRTATLPYSKSQVIEQGVRENGNIHGNQNGMNGSQNGVYANEMNGGQNGMQKNQNGVYTNGMNGAQHGSGFLPYSTRPPVPVPSSHEYIRNGQYDRGRSETPPNPPTHQNPAQHFPLNQNPHHNPHQNSPHQNFPVHQNPVPPHYPVHQNPAQQNFPVHSNISGPSPYQNISGQSSNPNLQYQAPGFQYHTSTYQGSNSQITLNGNTGKPRQANPFLRDYAVCGLKNLGSSCYINSTLQVLAAIGFLGKFLATANKNGRIAPNSSTDAMFGLISTFDANGGANVAPTKFLRILASAKPDFNIPYEQQDAQEFLLFLLDKMHAELATKPTDTEEFVDYSKKWRINVNPKEKTEYYKWYNGLLKQEGESIINDIFQGHIQSKLLCNTCGHHSISYSSFNILSLPIPGGNDQHVDLTDCLKYYTQDEVLSGENAWRCPKCNKEKSDESNPMDIVFQPKRGLFKFSKRSKSPGKKAAVPAPPTTNISIKQLSFIKLPPVLFIHLSRFSMLNVTDKLNTDIIYPLRLKFNHTSHDIYYSLTGLINHFGTLKSGHYTSLVNKRKVPKGEDSLANPFWCYFDDDNVRSNVKHGDIASLDGSSLHSRDVYVLCYERM